MASKLKRPSGATAIQFINRKKERKTLSLGHRDDEFVDNAFRAVEDLLEAAKYKTEPQHKTKAWLAKLSNDDHTKFAEVGLVVPRVVKDVVTLAGYAEQYKARRTDLGPATKLILGHVVRNLKAFFGETPIEAVTRGDADDFSRWLQSSGRDPRKGEEKRRGLHPATLGKRLSWSATICTDAVKRGILAENPFRDVRKPIAVNPERQQYVPRETVELLIDAEINWEWKALFALSRFQGVRVPSEAFCLAWDDIDWQRRRIKVPSPKTARIGKPYRIAPLLPETYAILDRLFHMVPDGTVYVLEKLRSRESVRAAESGMWGNVNLRSQMLKRLKKHKIAPWPKLWHALRASAETDLAAKFPLASVASWLGNSPSVAARHYLTARDADMDLASGSAALQSALQSTGN